MTRTRAKTIVPNLSEIIVEEGFLHLPITANHMVRSVFLPSDHRDPFDRILAAQALAENIPMLSVDKLIADLGAQRLW